MICWATAAVSRVALSVVVVPQPGAWKIKNKDLSMFMDMLC